MMSEADNTAKSVCDAMVAKHAKKANTSDLEKLTNIGSRTPCG